MTTSATNENSAVSVFISHRHIDSSVADVFREEIRDWSDGRASIYQSSAIDSASKIGTRLDVAIAQAIAETNLVLLIYTDAPGDYDWCMYECGLAQDPTGLDTNIGIFFTTEELPDPMDNRIGTRLTREDIKKLVYNFHKTPDFFARHPKPFRADVSDEYIEQKAQRLYKRLKEACPRVSADTPVYDRITLGLNSEHVEQIIAASKDGGQRAAFEVANDLVAKFGFVRSYSGDPQEHFNYDTFEENMSAGKLFERWRQDSEPSASDNWRKELCQSIATAVLNRPERSVSTPFQSLSGSQWLLPLLARFRVIPYEEVYEFDILFCIIDSSVASRMVGD